MVSRPCSGDRRTSSAPLPCMRRPVCDRSDDALVILLLTFVISTVQGLSATTLNVHPMCVNFTQGNEALREFYSPGWPKRYPNNTNCTRTLTAPEGQIIEIDFRDNFHLEPSPNCENDYLLIRDGKEAYSPMIRRSCGHQFPKMVTSSGRHMWLSFKSDETIEYDGFKAVYTFKRAESRLRPPACRFDLTGPEIIISTNNITEESITYAQTNRLPLDCIWRITVTPGKEIQVYFKEFVLAKPNECELNFVEILSGPELLLRRKQYFCSSKANSVKMGMDNDVTFRFYAAHSTLASQKTRILAVITETRLRTSEEVCLPTEFDCDDLYCINRSLVCNGNFNCDKLLDEKADCDKAGEEHALAFLTTNSNIVIMTVGCSLLFGMCFSMFWNCIRKLREDFREKEESIRRCRDGGLSGSTPALPLDPGGCYVPGADIKADFLASPTRNGTGGIVRAETIETDVDSAEVASQTRSGRAAAGTRSGSHASRGSGSSHDTDQCHSSPPPPPPPTRSWPHGPPISPFPEDHCRVTPPPPPPPPPPLAVVSAYDGWLNCDLHRPRTLPKTGRTDRVGGGRQRHSDKVSEWQCGAGLEPRYRTEAVIEMTARPHSLQSARSAPDVVSKI